MIVSVPLGPGSWTGSVVNVAPVGSDGTGTGFAVWVGRGVGDGVGLAGIAVCVALGEDGVTTTLGASAGEDTDVGDGAAAVPHAVSAHARIAARTARIPVIHDSPRDEALARSSP